MSYPEDRQRDIHELRPIAKVSYNDETADGSNKVLPDHLTEIAEPTGFIA